MLCAHYDSVSTSPGAGDDASGVAVMLESLSHLKPAHPWTAMSLRFLMMAKRMGFSAQSCLSTNILGPRKSGL